MRRDRHESALLGSPDEATKAIRHSCGAAAGERRGRVSVRRQLLWHLEHVEHQHDALLEQAPQILKPQARLLILIAGSP